VRVRATNTGATTRSFHVLVDFRDSAGKRIGNDVAVFRHLPSRQSAERVLAPPGQRLATCEVKAVSHF
jgi:hypothetical protein